MNNLLIKFPNLSKRQQSPFLQGYLCQEERFLKIENSVPMTAFYFKKDKNVCQSSKYYRNNILNCL